MPENSARHEDVEVVDLPDRSRFELRVSGEPAGRADYRQEPGRLVLTHTEVSDAYEGQGLGSRLAREALETARDRGLRVTPLCPYIARYIRRHREYADLVDDAHLADVDAPQPE
ncbi:GNAT family N-acetyltransferase [Streptomyces sp. DSM 42041]|uniref:GNAT family N-acetyltransferase n=1 Tax=Streptomyces hazeniae TaxID=3075538 RepID=A0ABU2NSQ6_9ACTN|nr:GNAT family N-acetyltransferase [Streptomyces sp. DSM 42041]MDT0379789.1 GNAT family N-acetyltransferase [Streptomyces sp. DSM 42041]